MGATAPPLGNRSREGPDPSSQFAGQRAIGHHGRSDQNVRHRVVRHRPRDDRVADYSSCGPSWFDAFSKPEIVAPGHRLSAAAATNQTHYTLYPSLRQTVAGRPYMTLSGTSMAASLVSGSVALLIQEPRPPSARPRRSRWTTGTPGRPPGAAACCAGARPATGERQGPMCPRRPRPVPGVRPCGAARRGPAHPRRRGFLSGRACQARAGRSAAGGGTRSRRAPDHLPRGRS
ncbi:MAG: hypothetical protein FJW39_30520 [Acidobacteria bacterium]|nr:hypothetical protein [Acidobacteriota bacterium]